MPDNIFPDLTNNEFDIKYNQLKILASDIRSRLFNQGQVTSTPVGQPQTGGGGGDDNPIPPGSGGCKKIYVANLSQSGTADPVASVYENTIGNIVWTRQAPGVYWGTLVGAFPAGFTWVMFNNPLIEGMDPDAEFDEMRAARINDDTIAVVTRNISPVNDNVDDLLNSSSIEIRTYCSTAELPDCVAVQDLSEFTIPSGALGVLYHHEYPLSGSTPIDIDVTTAPAWLTISIVDDLLIFNGTPDAAGSFDVAFSLTNCAEVQNVTASAEIIEVGDFFIINHLVNVPDGYAAQVDFQGMAAGKTGWVDWGDDTDLEAFNSGAGGTMSLTHTYVAARDNAQQLFFFDTNAVITKYINQNNAEPLVIAGVGHSDNFTNLTGWEIYGVNNPADIMPPNPDSHITRVMGVGHPSSTATAVDLSILDANVIQYILTDFPLLESITNVPSTVTGEFRVQNCPALFTIGMGAMGNCSLIQIEDVGPVPVTDITADPNLGNRSMVLNNISGWVTSDVNTLLVYVDSFGTSSHVLQILQTPFAPPSGAGSTAKTNLQGRSWFVVTN